MKLATVSKLKDRKGRPIPASEAVAQHMLFTSPASSTRASRGRFQLI